jgi:hypothetical protein
MWFAVLVGAVLGVLLGVVALELAPPLHITYGGSEPP